MVKKILFTVLGGAVALLVLIFALILLLSYRAFFGLAITVVLCICVVALAAFVVYLVVRYVLETKHTHQSSEESLSEHHIKEMLLSGEPRDKGVIRDGAVEISAGQAAPENLFDSAPPAPPKARRAAQQTAELRKQEEEHRSRLAEAEARARQAAQAEQAARQRSVGDTGRHLAGTGELLRRTLEQPAIRTQPAENPEISQEVKSVRRQAEAAAAARRRAAQMAARSQSFPAIRPDTLAAIGQQDDSGSGSLYAEAAGSKIRYANEPLPYEASGEDSIWDRMEVRRSAAPILTQDERLSLSAEGADEHSGEQEAAFAQPPVRQRTASIRLEAVHEAADGEQDDPAAAQSWAYTPAKPPRAWNTGDTARRIPGDMAYNPPPADPDSPDARAEAAAERKAAAATKTKEAAARTTTTTKSTTAAKAATTKTAAAKSTAKAAGEDAAEKPKTVYRKTAAEAAAEKKETPAKSSAAAAATTPEGEPVKRPRGRPPKPKTEEELNAPKRPRGRPPKPKTEEELNAPKRPRGRPPKPKTEEELNAPKRPRGRPRKNPLPEDAEAANATASTAEAAKTASAATAASKTEAAATAAPKTGAPKAVEKSEG